MTIWTYQGNINGGSMDGSFVVVTAWQPNAEEIKLINEGKPIFLTFVGGLPPHYPSMDFISATHPA